MIRLGLVGLADPRHRWFLAPIHRRRAGIRLVGASEPGPDRRDVAAVGELPIHQDHLQLLAQEDPDVVAVTRGPGSARAIVDALNHGVDVVAVPPLADNPVELAAITAAVIGSGSHCLTAHTLRGQPAALLARELLAEGRLGSLEVVTLIIGEDCTVDERRSLIVDVLDLFCLLSGATSGTIGAIDEGHPAREADPPEFRTGYGELIMMASATVDGSEIVCEVRSRTSPGDWPLTVQVGGSSGAVEWDVRTGMLRSVLADTDPRLVSAGPIDHPEWVLNNLLRRQGADISTERSLATTRMLLAAEHSAENDGSLETWSLHDSAPNLGP